MRFFLLLILPALLIALLSGCAAIPFTDEAKARNLMENVTQFYQTDATIRSGGVEMRAHIYRPDPITSKVEILYPERAAGFVYSFREGGIELSFQGLSFNLDSYVGTRSAPVPRAVMALSSLLLPEAERSLPSRQNGVWVLRGEFGGENCLLFLDEEGLPLKLLLQGSEVEFVFENFVFLG